MLLRAFACECVCVHERKAQNCYLLTLICFYGWFSTAIYQRKMCISEWIFPYGWVKTREYAQTRFLCAQKYWKKIKEPLTAKGVCLIKKKSKSII